MVCAVGITRLSWQGLPGTFQSEVMQSGWVWMGSQLGFEPSWSVHLQEMSSQLSDYVTLLSIPGERSTKQETGWANWKLAPCELLPTVLLTSSHFPPLQPELSVSHRSQSHSKAALLASPGGMGQGRRVRGSLHEAVTPRGTTLMLLITLSAFIEKMLSVSEFATMVTHLLGL